MPVVNDPKEYGDHWNAWWWSMHPSWRDPESPFNILSVASAGSWSHLLCGGPNGLLLVILALSWWMKCNTGTIWVLAQLRLALDVSDKGKKRELEVEPDDSDNLPSAKRYLILSQYQIEDKN